MICKVIPFGAKFIATPLLLKRFNKNIKKSFEDMIKAYPNLKYLLPERRK